MGDVASVLCPISYSTTSLHPWSIPNPTILAKYCPTDFGAYFCARNCWIRVSDWMEGGWSSWVESDDSGRIQFWFFAISLVLTDKVTVLMVFWDCLWMIGLFHSQWYYWTRQSQSDKTVFPLRRSPTDWPAMNLLAPLAEIARSTVTLKLVIFASFGPPILKWDLEGEGLFP